MLCGNRLFLCLIAPLIGAVPCRGAANTTARPLKVYAHYMGCLPAGSGPLDYDRYNEAPKLRHDSPNERLASAAIFATGTWCRSIPI